MIRHIRVHLNLLLATFAICAVAYPAVLWAFGRAFFSAKSQGSLIETADKRGGSRLIGQNFTGAEYFQPRPSAAGNGYDAKASGGSNFGANNPKLRDRVARQLGPIVKYSQTSPKKDDSVQKDIEKWFQDWAPKPGEPSFVVRWAKANSTLAKAWVKDDTRKAAVIDWLRTHPDILAEWKKNHPDDPAVDLADDKTIPFDDIAEPFFESWASANPKFWPEPEEFETAVKDAEGKPIKAKRLKPVAEGADIQATFFDSWLQEHSDAVLEKVPADMVMASGSGLDPHITLKNALYQLDGVAEAWAKKTSGKPDAIKPELERLVQDHADPLLFGLAGEPIVNVLELNLSVREKMQR